ncbi:MAG: helix-turn-helix domain-containing protein [Lachnospiraceae bacterium]|nr:helix-turn-helix domain-containing protein [Lachnospiraceae bacterium]
MYINSAYLNNSRQHFMDKSKPLVVGSCGTYHLFTRPRLPTFRPKGRIDYQLLYIAAGKAHFYFQKDVEEIVTAGHMVLYRPKEMQKYVYYGEDQTEVYWVHFTGRDVKQLLRKYRLPQKGHVFYTGTSPDYQRLFRKMIQELQMCKPFYEDFLAILLQQIFVLISRQLTDSGSGKKLNDYAQNEAEAAAVYFNQHYNKEICIEKYAASRNMSTSWFIRNFRQYNGITPMKYILSIRISNAQHLLETTAYNINEIADIVGYDNPLYFSRLFKKQVGLSPSEYRRQNEMPGD